MLTLLNRQIPQNLVLLPELFQYLIPSLWTVAFLGEGGFIGGIPGLLCMLRGIDVARLHLLDGM